MCREEHIWFYDSHYSMIPLVGTVQEIGDLLPRARFDLECTQCLGLMVRAETLSLWKNRGAGEKCVGDAWVGDIYWVARWGSRDITVVALMVSIVILHSFTGLRTRLTCTPGQRLSALVPCTP